ncbi:MAG: 4Fe-4S dicluster domain-containing protein [Candidatus Bathyarchaeota archaeon]|nr:4Fe-4S dicluster domain-containing protein [Candidatus Bathyarchaeota archaeon]
MKRNDSRYPEGAYTRIAQLVGRLFLVLFRKVSALSGALSPTSVSTLKPSTKPTYFRPPGAVDEQDFVNVCLRCRRCVEVCPTKSIRPLSFLKGLRVAWTPVIKVDSDGYCIRCLKCTKVCPSGALEKISRDKIKIGIAAIDETKCYDWTVGESSCSKCINTCPLVNEGQIAIKLIDGKPVVQMDTCIGCAICAIRCPADAITISPYEEGIERSIAMEGEKAVV